MLPDDLTGIDRLLYGSPVRRAFWALVHRLPCAVVHRVCPLCRADDACDRCCPCADCAGSALDALPSSVGLIVAPGSTSASAAGYVYSPWTA